ncbi:folylpolyglutamate synthase [Pseudocyphellaria aurata]|nr:folylpolyglutamate synthase [Pseudocyphellaria aurata]
MIELGLERISRLLKNTILPWRAIHVAGTNGKGSVCAYASAMLKAGNIRCGRFTSPHLIDRWDCITIDEKTVNENVFREVEASIQARDKGEGIGASEFELLTATAFEIFAREKVEVGVVEVGMGGRHDATNILRHPLVTVITKIGKDHESFLGNSLEEIADHKAGIMKEMVPCIIDATNAPQVLRVLEENAKKAKAGPLFRISNEVDDSTAWIWNLLSKEKFEAHQQINICLAVHAVKSALERTHSSLEIPPLLQVIPETLWPGRLQYLSIKEVSGRERDVLLDGAHNAQSADVLRSYVDAKLRGDGPVTWVLAFSKGKKLSELLLLLVRPGDNIIASGFGPVDGMPWVQPVDVKDILGAAETLGIPIQAHTATDTRDALRQATQISNNGPVVVAGSLYQVSDVLRLLRGENISNV